jgi:hypothetical protein
MDKLPVTSGLEWRRNREEGELVQLPYSGKIIRLRTVRPDQLLRLGKIPNPLAALMVDIIYGNVDSDRMSNFLDVQEGVESAMDLIESLRVVCTAAFVEPKIVDNPTKDNEISFDDLELSDRSYVFRLTFVSAEALKTFRYKPPSDVEVASNGAADPQPSIVTSGDAE